MDTVFVFKSMENPKNTNACQYLIVSCVNLPKAQIFYSNMYILGSTFCKLRTVISPVLGGLCPVFYMFSVKYLLLESSTVGIFTDSMCECTCLRTLECVYNGTCKCLNV